MVIRLLMSAMSFAAFASAVIPGVSSGDDLTEAEFLRLHRQLQPAPEEPWRTIPWKIALLDAQRTAAREQKPIFIWAMDGHPLGCT